MSNTAALLITFTSREPERTRITLKFETGFFGGFGQFLGAENVFIVIDPPNGNLRFEGALPQPNIVLGLNAGKVTGTITAQPPIPVPIFLTQSLHFPAHYFLPAGQSSGKFSFTAIGRDDTQKAQSEEELLEGAAKTDFAQLAK